MKSVAILLFLCGYLRGADDIRLAVSAKTNAQSGTITTKEFFTRGGKTNLVRHTKAKAGKVEIRIHRFYREGALLGDYIALPDSSAFATEAGSPCSISFEYGKNKEVKSASIANREGEILDAFTCTNGLFFPIESPQLRKMNALGDAVRARTRSYERE